MTDEEWELARAVFGPWVPGDEELARIIRNPEVNEVGMELMHSYDIVDQLGRIECPTLVAVGELDPVTPVDCSREIVDALPDRLARLEVIAGAGHFPWRDAPDRFWPMLTEFVLTIA